MNDSVVDTFEYCVDVESLVVKNGCVVVDLLLVRALVVTTDLVTVIISFDSVIFEVR